MGLLLLALFLPALGSAAAAPPNVLFTYLDDFGWRDAGFMGSDFYETPHLDALARQGLRFTHFYNTARCCPARASLLTGLYPHQAGVGHMVNNRGFRPYQGYLRDDCVTIAEVLRLGGYRTLMSGKWHCGGIFARNDPENWRVGDPERPLPPDRGFDEWWGTPAGAGSSRTTSDAGRTFGSSGSATRTFVRTDSGSGPILTAISEGSSVNIAS